MIQIQKLETAVSKKSLDQMAVAFIDEALSQEKEMEAAQLLSSMENFVKSVKERDEFKNAVRDRIALYGKNHELPTGTKLEQCEVGVKYDYSQCNDPAYKALVEQMEVLKEAVKNQETFLKSVPLKGLLITDEETGEAYEVYPPSKTSTSSYKVSLAK